jgi:hypothetical protein
MTARVTRRRLATSLLGLWAGASLPLQLVNAAGPRTPDPTQILPLTSLSPEHQISVAEVIRDHTIHRKGPTDSFPCHSQVYLNLLNEPAITLALWKDLAESPVQLQQISPGKYVGSDGNGASATWEFAYRSAKMHVFHSNLDYKSPRGNTHLQGRIVLIVRSGFYRESNGEPYVQHDIEAFVKVDSKGWKTLARTVRPILEKVLEEQVQEAGLFVSLMGRLVETYPNWAVQIATTKSIASEEAKNTFRDVVVQNRRKNAASGRPTMMTNAAPPPAQRRRS